MFISKMVDDQLSSSGKVFVLVDENACLDRRLGGASW